MVCEKVLPSTGGSWIQQKGMYIALLPWRKSFSSPFRGNQDALHHPHGGAHTLTYTHTHIQEPIRVHDLEFQFRKGYTQFAI